MKRKLINSIKFEFPSKSVNEGFSRSAAAAFASQLDPTLEELCDIKTAVSEAVTNAVVHAYPERSGPVVILMKIFDDGLLEISVKDKGCGIPDIALARTPAYTTGDTERSGMGFTIMESFMGSLSVKSTPGVGTTVKMRKLLSTRDKQA